MSFIGSYNPHLLDGVQHVHFIGCGGSGTYPLIQILHSRGLTISGSDVEETKITKAERAMGVTVYLEHDAAHWAMPSWWFTAPPSMMKTLS